MPIVRARKLCSKYAELYGPGVSTTRVDVVGIAGDTERSVSASRVG